jgi:kynurenine formamidase
MLLEIATTAVWTNEHGVEAPLKITGGDASPARVLALVE